MSGSTADRGDQNERDQSWLAREADFTALYRENAEAVLSFFAKRTTEPQVALDLTAETFAQAFAGRRRFRGRSDEQARAWLFAIASNLLAAFSRKGYAERRMVRRLRIEVPVAGEELERLVELDAMRQLRPLIEHELGRLSREQREAVRLCVIDELAFATIASRLGISEPAARMRVSRALNALADALQRTTITSEEPR